MTNDFECSAFVFIHCLIALVPRYSLDGNVIDVLLPFVADQVGAKPSCN